MKSQGKRAAFPARLRRARLGKDWTQDVLADRTGIEKPRLSRYENGHIEPRLDTVEVLADALAVSPGWLVGWER